MKFYIKALTNTSQCFWIYWKFQIFFEKLSIFHARDLEHFCDQYSSIVTTFNHLRVATAQSNFLRSFLSLIPRNSFGFLSKLKMLFENFICDQYTSIVPALNFIWVATAEWNFLHSFHSLIPRNIFGFISKIPYIFWKTYTS